MRMRLPWLNLLPGGMALLSLTRPSVTSGLRLQNPPRAQREIHHARANEKQVATIRVEASSRRSQRLRLRVKPAGSSISRKTTRARLSAPRDGQISAFMNLPSSARSLNSKDAASLVWKFVQYYETDRRRSSRVRSVPAAFASDDVAAREKVETASTSDEPSTR